MRKTFRTFTHHTHWIKKRGDWRNGEDGRGGEWDKRKKWRVRIEGRGKERNKWGRGERSERNADCPLFFKLIYYYTGIIRRNGDFTPFIPFFNEIFSRSVCLNMASHRSFSRSNIDYATSKWNIRKICWIEHNISPGYDFVKYLQNEGFLPISRKCQKCFNPMTVIRHAGK